MRTADLMGAYLDYFTGLADGKDRKKLSIRRVQRTDTLICVYNGIVRYAPSTDPVKGVEIIERDGICMVFHPEFGNWSSGYPATRADGYEYWAHCQYAAPSMLIAACRAKVASIYGAEVPDIEITE